MVSSLNQEHVGKAKESRKSREMKGSNNRSKWTEAGLLMGRVTTNGWDFENW